MRYALLSFAVLTAGCLAALWYLGFRHSVTKRKPKKDERVSPRWLNEHVYERGQDGDEAA